MLTIVVLTYNGEHLLPDCIRSINSQFISYEHRKVIIDNGSKNPVTGYPGWDVIRIPNNHGHIHGINKAFEYADEGWVLFVSNDVRLGRYCINNMMRATVLNVDQLQPVILKPNGEIDNVGMDYVWPGYGIGRTKWKGHRTPVIPNIIFMCKKYTWRKVGGFIEGLKSGYEDVDFGLRVRGRKIVVKGATATHLGNATLKNTLKDVRKIMHRSRMITVRLNFKGFDRWLRLTAIRIIDSIRALLP